MWHLHITWQNLLACRNDLILYFTFLFFNTSYNKPKNNADLQLQSVINYTIVYLCALLLGCPIGRITHLVNPSVCMYVCPSILYGLVTQKQKSSKIKISINVTWATVSGVILFSWKGQRLKPPDVKNHTKLASCLLTDDWSSTGRSGTNCKLDLTIVRPKSH